MYQALYRKWRPRTFDDVVGQEQVTETLKNQIAAGRTSHAYLFVGVRGTGKTTCAKILARAVNCEAPENGNPCNKCQSCIGIESGAVMDVVEIDAASNNGVENVRALREEAVYTPASVKKRVYIIDEVHMLSTSAFNALLKILEEPPEHLVFILATTEIHKVLPTILSRCQRYSFGRIAPEAIAGRLSYIAQNEKLQLEPDAAALLSRLADGSMRDGISLLDQCSDGTTITSERVLSAMGLAGSFRIAELLENISGRDSAGAIELFETLWREGKSPATLLGELVALLRDIMLLSVAPKGGKSLLSGGFDDKTLASLCGRIRGAEAMEYISLLQNSIGALRDGRDPKIEAELCIIGMCEPELLDSPERLGLRISRLEKSIAEGISVTPAAPPIAEASAESTPEPSTNDVPWENDEPTARDDAHIDPPAEMPENVATPDESSVSEADSTFEKETFSTPVSSSSGDDIWPALYAELKRTMPPFHLAHLSGAAARIENSKLILSVGGAFARSQLEKPEPTELIRSAIKAVTGETLPLTLEEAAPAPVSTEKLDALAKFDNVKFE